jgi:succinoglycan biosynthesis protein ExoM
MLKDCLRSLMVQETPSQVRLTVVVVENDAESRCRSLVEEMARQPGAPRIVYGHEAEIGIPFARNRSLDLALEHDADWIGFIDDDEIASPDWIAKLAAAAARLDADVLQGPVEAIYPPQASRLLQKAAKRRPTGTRRCTAYTNNTLMRASIARKQGLGLRFDEAMRFTGGSDVEFFSRAVAHGAVIRWVDEAVVSESVPMARLTLRWQLERARRTGANRACLDAQRNGSARGRQRERHLPWQDRQRLHRDAGRARGLPPQLTAGQSHCPARAAQAFVERRKSRRGAAHQAAAVFAGGGELTRFGLANGMLGQTQTDTTRSVRSF